MKLLIDTHVLLWAATDPERIASETREVLEDGAHGVLVSVVTGWELAIKQSLGKLELPKPAERWLPDVVNRTGFGVAELGLAAALRVRALPWHHRDPFDRLMIAQALEEGLTFVTRDAEVALYGVPFLKA